MRDREKIIRETGEYYDAATGGRGSEAGRERAIEQALRWADSPVREDRPARAHPRQSVYDTQPERKRIARYRREIHQVKQLAAAPLRPTRVVEPKPADPTEPTLF